MGNITKRWKRQWQLVVDDIDILEEGDQMRKKKCFTAIAVMIMLILSSNGVVYGAELDAAAGDADYDAQTADTDAENSLSIPDADGMDADSDLLMEDLEDSGESEEEAQADGEDSAEENASDGDTLTAIVAALNGEEGYDLADFSLSIAVDDGAGQADSEMRDEDADELLSVLDGQENVEQVIFTADENGTLSGGGQSLNEYLDGLLADGITAVEATAELPDGFGEEPKGNELLMQRLEGLSPIDGVESADEAADDADRPMNLRDLLDGDLPDVDEAVEVDLYMQEDEEDEDGEAEDDEDLEEDESMK